MDEHRQLAAIMFTDVVGYTALMAENESEALFLLKKFRKILKRAINRSGGEWLETSGDGVLASFTSAVDAVNCALVVQHHLADEDRLRIRIGIHVGDVIYAQGQVFGDGVNIASRIEALAGPRDIAISEQVHDAVRNKQGISTEFLGRKQLKNVDHPVGVYLLSGEEIETPDLSGLDEHDRRRVSGRGAITLVAIAVVAMLAVVFYSKQEGARASLHSVAVLPFRNMSEDPANEYFSDGLAEELLDTLTRMEGLQVASRTSSFSFKNREMDAPEIAGILQVANLLNGSVRKQDNHVRITVELVDGENGMRVWSQTYDRQLDDIFFIQEDIAREIAGNLRLVLSPETEARISQPPTESIEAYDDYLQGLAYLNGPIGDANLNEAEQFFQRALAIDPEYARAHAAMCKVFLAKYTLANATTFIDEARARCDRALALDPALTEVLVALGQLDREIGQFEAAEKQYLLALEQRPRFVEALIGLGETYKEAGQVGEAETVLRKAVDVEPGNWRSSMALGKLLYWRVNFDEALAQFERVIELSPNNAHGYLFLSATLDYLDRPDESEQALLRSIEIEPSRAAYRDLGLVYYYDGEFLRAAEAFRNALEFSSVDHWSWGNLAQAHAAMDESYQELAASEFQKARDLAAESLESNPKDWRTMSRLAMYEARIGETETSFGLADEAVANGSDVPDVLVNAALAFALRGNENRVIELLETAIAKGYPGKLIENEPVFGPFVKRLPGHLGFGEHDDS